MLDNQDEPVISKGLEALMTAFANVPNRRLKLLILSIYAHKYPVKTLIRLQSHMPKSLNGRLIKRALTQGYTDQEQLKRQKSHIEFESTRRNFITSFSLSIGHTFTRTLVTNVGDEGNNILNASDMRTALKERQVSGTRASACRISEAKNSLEIKKVKRFSTFHNFQYESNGIRLWKAYGIGERNLFKNDSFLAKAFRSSSPPNDNIRTTVPLRRRPINQHVPEDIYNISNCTLRTSPAPQESMSESSRRPKVITCKILVRITNRNIKSRHNSKQANFNNLKEFKTLPLIGSRTKNSEFGSSVLLANTMPLLPKIDEVRCVVHEENPDLVCITET